MDYNGLIAFGVLGIATIAIIGILCLLYAHNSNVSSRKR